MKTPHILARFVKILVAAALPLLTVTVVTACSDDIDTPADTPAIDPPAALPDVVHENIRTQPYPKAGDLLYLNPPPLLVPQPEDMKVTEGGLQRVVKRVQFALSRSKDFATEATEQSEPLARCFYNPHRQLEEGTWYWRYRIADTETGTEGAWSETCSFEMTADVPVFVTPAFARFTEQMPQRYPMLYCFLDPNLDAARSNAPAHSEYKALMGRAQSAIRYLATLTTDPHLQASTLRQHLRSLYDAYHLTRLYEYEQALEQALDQLLQWGVTDAVLFASNFQSTDIAGSYARLYDALYRKLDSTQRQAVEELLLRVVRKYLPMHIGAEENHIFDNHFWQQNMRILFQSALLLANQETYRKEMLAALEYYYELWTARAPASGFNRDGVWHNGSGYFNANIHTLAYMPLLFSYVTRTDFFRHPWYRNAGQPMLYTWPPASKSSGFGDGSEQGDIPARQRVAFADLLARETGSGYAGWYASQCAGTLKGDVELRLYRMCASRSYDTTLPDDAPRMVWNRDAGEVTMHSCLTDTDRDVNLSFRSSPFGSGSHTTSSQNAFNLLYRGSEVYRSSGYYLNFSDAHNLMSYRHTRAHNTLLVNGIGQAFSVSAYGNVTHASESEYLTYCTGDASHAYDKENDYKMWTDALAAAGIEQTAANGFGTTPLTRYLRHVLMLHPEGTVIVYDEIEASEPATFDWLLHSPQQMHVSNELSTVTLQDKEAEFTATTRLFCRDAMELSVTDQFRVPPTEVYNPAYPNQWHFTARIEGVDKTRVVAIIQTKPFGESAQALGGDGSLIRVGEWTIEPELDAQQPARLVVTHATLPVHFELPDMTRDR